MVRNISQDKIIRNLNDYLEWHNLPIVLNKMGVCNGLSTIYAKYVLEGKTDEFMDLLGHVSGEKEIHAEHEEKIDKFIMEVILSYMPEEFNKSLNQFRSYEGVYIDNKPLQSIFKVGMVAKNNDWEEIFSKIELQNDEVMVLHGSSHAVSISREDNQYVVYDPNYTSGQKFFSNEKELMQELHENVFRYTNDNLGMHVNILQNPTKNEARIKELPKVDEIYKQYLNADNISQRAEGANFKPISTIEIASYFNNGQLMSQLAILEKNTENIELAALMAAKNNNQEVLIPLLPKLDDKQKQGVCLIILVYGRLDAFNVFLKADNGKEVYNSLIEDNETRGLVFSLAAQGGNKELLEQVIFSCKNLSSDLMIQTILGADDVITSSIKGKDPQCLKLVLRTLDNANYKMSDETKLQYLLFAIDSNQPQMVQVLAERMSKNALQEVNLDLAQVGKADIAVLKILQENGMVFSLPAKAVIAEKEHRPVGLIFTIGIALSKFSAYCKEVLFKVNQETVSFDKDKFKAYKTALMEQIKHEEPETNSELLVTPEEPKEERSFKM